MLMTALMFAIACVAIEMFLVTQYEWAKKFMLRFEKFGIFFSIALSWVVGEFFGAQGVIVLMSAMFSTVITTIIYKCHLLKWVDVMKTEEFKAKIQLQTDRLVKTVRFAWAVITFPGTVWQKGVEVKSSASAKITTIKGKVRRSS